MKISKQQLDEAIAYVRTPGYALVRINADGAEITSHGAAHCAIILLAALEMQTLMEQT